MKSNYKLLGPYIREINLRNTEGKEENLLGVSTSKVFIQSIANTVGTNFKKYKIVNHHQFTYVPDTSRRGDRIGIALLEDYQEGLVSSAYTVFEIINHEELLSEYLMMWFRRTEFDRYARFKSHGSVREMFDWEEMCNVELPVPEIEKQKAIVKEYNTIVNRIKLNEELNKKLEETAQAIYKQWFVDFEFPDENGKSYKSSGGEMVWCEELEKEIPKEWENIRIQQLIDENIIYKNQDGNHGEIHPKSSDFVTMGIPFIMARDLEYGTINLKACKFITSDQSKKLRIKPSIHGDVLLTHKATMGRVSIVPELDEHIVLTPQVTFYRVKNNNKINKEFLYCLFNSSQFQSNLLGDSEQSTRNFLSITNQRSMKILFPAESTIEKFKLVISQIFKHKTNVVKENYVLDELMLNTNAKMAKG